MKDHQVKSQHNMHYLSYLLFLAVSVVSPLSAHTPGRMVYNFNLDWLFEKSDSPAFQQSDFDDSNWTEVSCPHTWNDIDTFDDFGRGGHQGESDMWMGTAWYRKHFRLPESADGKRIILEFEGVRQIADVFINGVLIGHNETGFIPFGLDLTDHIDYDGSNVIAVKVDNTTDPHLTGDRPWHHQNWHPPHGGIYRNVRLHALDPIHVTLPLYADLETQGMYAWTEDLDPSRVTVGIQIEVANSTPNHETIEVLIAAKDEFGKQVGSANERVDLRGSEKTLVTTEFIIDEPLFWEPKFPHVYEIEVKLQQKGGKLRDVASIPYAPRVFRWDRTTGFWMNGKNTKLHGWGHKPTGSWAGLGAGLPDWMRDYTLKQMWEAGSNIIRWGHSAGSATEVRMSDQYGLITIMPGVDGERDCFGKAWETRRNAFRDTVIYFRNHPGILIWEGGNYNINPDHTQELRAIIDEWDPHGRRYFGFRMSTPAMLPYIDIEIGTIGRRRALPMLPVVESEYDRMEAPRRLWDKYSPPYFGCMGKDEERNTFRSDSEIFAKNAVEEWWNLFENKPDHSGGANWIFHDEPHGTRQVTDTARTTGEVDGVRLPKESYFAIKTMWSGQDGAHLIGHWNYPEETVKTVYAVIAGAHDAELILNGRSLGFGRKTDNYLYSWDDVAFEPGELRVIGSDPSGETVATDSLVTVGEPASLRLTSIESPKGWQADGSDVILIDVEVVDREGRRCPTAHPKVEFEVTGAGVWRGGYNSGREDSTNNKHLFLECGINRVSVRSLREPGTVTLTVHSDGLKSHSISFSSKPVEAHFGVTGQMPVELSKPKLQAVEWDRDLIASEFLLSQQDRIVANEAETGGSLFSSYAYTGIGWGETDKAMAESTLAYTDSALHYLDKLPDYLSDARVSRTALSDTNYWASDYIVASASQDLELFVAHDPMVPVPSWMSKFEQLNEVVTIRKRELKLYKSTFATGQIITISGNVDQGVVNKNAFNMVLFVKPL